LLIHFTANVSNPVLMFSILLAVILLVPLVSTRLKIPSIVGFILSGALLGPGGFNVMSGESKDTLIAVWSIVGLLYIMFIAGLEFDLYQFSKHKHRSIVFGVLEFVITTMVASFLSVLLLKFNLLSAILFGSMLASRTLVAYPIISRLGLTKRDSLTTTLGGTIITDTATLLVLAVVVSLAREIMSIWFLCRLGVSLTLFFLIVFWGVPIASRWFFKNVSGDGGAQFLFVLTVVFTCGYLCHLAGMEPIIGAFMAGLALNCLISEGSLLKDRILFVGNNLFIPVFLFSVGMLVNVQNLISDIQIWIVAGVMLAASLVTKYIAARIVQALFGYSQEEGWIIFGLSIAQATVVLAVVEVGYNERLFNEAVLDGTVILILVTCLISPWIVERFGKKLALEEETSLLHTAALDKRLLVPVANPHTAGAVISFALLFRDPVATKTIYPMTVVQDGGNVDEQVAKSEHMLQQTISSCSEDIAIVPTIRIDSNPADGILRAVSELQAKTVIIGWGGESVGAFIFGTILEQLLKRCGQRILVFKPAHPLNTAKRTILCLPPFVERLPGFDETIQDFKRFAKQIGTNLQVVGIEFGFSSMQKRIKQVYPQIPTSFISKASLQEIRMFLSSCSSDDVIVLFSAREGTVAWQPGLAHLPGAIAKNSPQSNIIVVYPPITVEEASTGTSSEDETSLSSLFPQQEGIVLNIGKVTPEESVEKLIETVFADDKTKKESLISELRKAVNEYPIELTEGVVLSHLHCPEVERTMVLVATSAEGINFKSIKQPANIMFLVLSPVGVSPELHLRTLSSIARFVHTAGAVDSLRKTSSPEEVKSLLAK